MISPPPPPQQQQQQFCIQPTEQDILCGRGRAHVHHPGNRKFAQLIQSNSQRYIESPRRIERTLLVAFLVQKILDDGSRFLKEDKRGTGQWTEMNIDQAHEKVGHAIRDLLKKRKATTIINNKSSDHAIVHETKKRRQKHQPQEGSSSASTTTIICANVVSEDEEQRRHEYAATNTTLPSHLARDDVPLPCYYNGPSFEYRHDLMNEEIIEMVNFRS